MGTDQAYKPTPPILGGTVKKKDKKKSKKK